MWSWRWWLGAHDCKGGGGRIVGHGWGTGMQHACPQQDLLEGPEAPIANACQSGHSSCMQLRVLVRLLKPQVHKTHADLVFCFPPTRNRALEGPIKALQQNGVKRGNNWYRAPLMRQVWASANLKHAKSLEHVHLHCSALTTMQLALRTRPFTSHQQQRRAAVRACAQRVSMCPSLAAIGLW